METSTPIDQALAKALDEDMAHRRGNSGPLHIMCGSGRNPLVNAFIQAGQQAGYPVTADYNGRQQEGFDAMEATIHNGRR